MDLYVRATVTVSLLSVGLHTCNCIYTELTEVYILDKFEHY